MADVGALLGKTDEAKDDPDRMSRLHGKALPLPPKANCCSEDFASFTRGLLLLSAAPPTMAWLPLLLGDCALSSAVVPASAPEYESSRGFADSLS